MKYTFLHDMYDRTQGKMKNTPNILLYSHSIQVINTILTKLYEQWNENNMNFNQPEHMRLNMIWSKIKTNESNTHELTYDVKTTNTHKHQ